MIRENSTVAILVINLKFRNYEKIVFNCYGSAQHDHDICGERGVEHDKHSQCLKDDCKLQQIG